MPDSQISLTAVDSAAAKLKRLNLDMADAARVIAYAQSSGSFLLSPASDHRFAHHQLGPVTLWVEYRPLGTGSFVLESVWMHRIRIIENYD